MKVNVNADCTPDEVRTFLGLPDLQSMQQRIMGEIEKRMLAGMDRYSPEAVMKRWMKLVPQGPEQMKEAFTRMFQEGAGKSNTPKK